MAAGKRFDAALEQLGRAGTLDPSNPQVDCMFGKVPVAFSLQKCHPATRPVSQVEYQKALIYSATGKHEVSLNWEQGWASTTAVQR